MASGKVARLFVVTLLVAGSPASAAWAEGPAPDKMACIAADTDGQTLRLAASLIEARRRFAVCAAASCPRIVRDDCLERIAEVEVAQPTVVFTATNGDGRPLVAVRVSVDGARIADRLDGRPLAVDPGEHVFVLEALGRLTAQMVLTLNEGEKRVRHAVVLRTGSGDPADKVPAPEPLSAADLVAPATLPMPVPTTPPSTPPADASPPVRDALPVSAGPMAGDAGSLWRGAAIAAAGVGAVGVVVGSVFGVMTRKKWDAASAGCSDAVCLGIPPDHQPERRGDLADARTDGAISTVAFIVGGVGIAAGAWLWFGPPGSSKSRSGIRVVPAAVPSQGQLSICGRF
jgi:hypothetical protein